MKKPAASYSRAGGSRTTLGDGALDFRVRYGNGYVCPSMGHRHEIDCQSRGRLGKEGNHGMAGDEPSPAASNLQCGEVKI